MYTLVNQLSTTNTTASTNRSIEYIVIHYTATLKSTKGSAKSIAKYFDNKDIKASADFIVDDETVVQYNPNILNRYTWHCGGSKYKTQGASFYGKCTNKNSIGIEICSTSTSKKIENANSECWSYSDLAIENAAELVKTLMEEYKIDADHVIRHYDVTGKLCPGIIGWNADSGDESKWNDFKQKIKKEETIDWKSMYEELLVKYEDLKTKVLSIKTITETVN